MAWRLFIAVELPAPVREALAATAQKLAACWRAGDARWTKAGNLHLTLRFLGDTNEERVDEVAAAIDAAATTAAPFELRLAHIGAFPAADRPRVVWVGLAGDGLATLCELQRDVEDRVQSLGWEPEGRAFKPHLTLGRVQPKARPPSGAWSEHTPPALPIAVSELVLIRSQLRPGGAEYTSLHRSALCARPSLCDLGG